jgi:hypothetical protein
MIAATRKKYDDLEFQFMELDTRCESELEQAETRFQNEQKFVTQNAQNRQVKSFLKNSFFVFLENIIFSEYITRTGSSTISSFTSSNN